MGQFHVAIVARDSELVSYEKKLKFTKTDEDNHFLRYEKFVFRRLREFLLHHFDTLPKSFKDISDDYKIEKSLEDLFQSEKKLWPYTSLQFFQSILFQKVQLNFTNQVKLATDALYLDLATDPHDQNLINLKVLRDYMIQKRKNVGLVFVWGINDQRNGRYQNENMPEQEQDQNLSTEGAIHIQPTLIRFNGDVKIVKVECGSGHTLALSSNGEVYSWGFGDNGCLGLGPNINLSITPQKVIFDYDDQDKEGMQIKGMNYIKILQISSGTNHCLALSENFEVYSWGHGQGGKLGHGDQVGKSKATKIVSLCQTKVNQIYCGDTHSGCISEKQQIFLWGVGLNGRLGLGTLSNIDEPQEMIQSFQIDRLFLGMTSSFATCRSGVSVCWGLGQYGKLGLDQSLDTLICEPRKLLRLKNENIIEFAAGPFHTLALNDKGQIFAFGNAKDEKLGIINKNDKNMNNDYPQLINSNVVFHQVDSSEDFIKYYPQFKNYSYVWNVAQNEEKNISIVQTCSTDFNNFFLTNQGQLYAYGQNDQNQCGDKNKKISEETTNESELKKYKKLYKYIEMIDQYEKNDDSQDEEEKREEERYIPKEARKYLSQFKQEFYIKCPEHINISIKSSHIIESAIIKHIAVSYKHVLATTDDGRCYGWGSNEFGQLGLGTLQQVVKQPTLNQCLIDQKINMCATGRNHSLFLTKRGQVFSAGLNDYGQLGQKPDIYENGIKQDFEEQDIQQTLGPLQQAMKSKSNIKEDQIIKVENFFAHRTKRTAELVQNLDQISFIACGNHHSCAITSIASSTPSEQLALYTWGWGVYGQLGNSTIKNTFNLSEPTKVEISNTKVAYVSCSKKHTLVLDVNNKIWYFGFKESVGVFLDDNICQFEPIRLSDTEDHHQFERKYSFLAAGLNENLAIELESNLVYKFGHKKIGQKSELKHQTKFDLVLNEDDIEIKSKFVSCGPDHFCSVNLENERKNIYVWQLSNQKCGLQPCSQVPVCIPEFESYFKNQQQTQIVYNMTKSQQFRETIEEKQQDDQQRKRLKYPVQIDIKYMNGITNPVEINEIKNMDNQLQETFQQTCEQFYAMINKINSQETEITLRAQDAVIARITNFPVAINRVERRPKVFLEYKQKYEVMFTYLQNHPCYIINLIKTKFISDQQSILRLINAVYGRNTILDNLRIINVLLVIAEKLLNFEMNLKSFTQIIEDKNSAFNVILKLILENQASSLKFFKQIARDIVRFLNTDNTFQNALQLSVKQIANQFDQLTRPVSDEASIFSHEVYSLVCRIFFLFECEIIVKKIEYDVKKIKEKAKLSIFNLILGLGLEKFKSFSEQQIQTELSDHNLNFTKIQFTELLNNILTFFQNKDAAISLADIKYLVVKASKKELSLNHREMAVNGLFNNYKKASDLTQILIQQIFTSSCELFDANLTIVTKDLFFVQNQFQELSNQDPLFDIIRDAPVQSKLKENQKINLKISSRPLLTHSKFVKCKDCRAAVSIDQIENQRFNDAFYGIKNWTCNCKIPKSQKGFICAICCQTIQKELLPKDLVYERYTQNNLSSRGLEFSEVLMLLPAIQEDQDFYEIMQQEIQRLENGGQTQLFNRLHHFKIFLDGQVAIEQQQQGQSKQLNEQQIEVLKILTRNKHLAILANEIQKQSNILKKHKQKVLQYNSFFPTLEQLKIDINKRNNYNLNQLNLLVFNLYTGLCSEFLVQKLRKVRESNQEEQKQQINSASQNEKMVWAGRYQIKDSLKIKEDKLQQFFKETGEQSIKSVVGRYSYSSLAKQVIISVDHDKNKLKRSYYIFAYKFENGSNCGFEVEIFLSSFGCFGSSETSLEKFNISKENLIENRRNFFTQSYVKYGSTVFSVFQLVKLLNKLVSISDVFSQTRQKKSDDESLKKKIITQEIEVNDWDQNITSLAEIQVIQETKKASQINQ